MRILLWIGNEPNQMALANKIHSAFPISGIITETRPYKRKITLAKVIERIFLPSIGKAWWNMHQHYKNIYAQYPKVDHLDVANINSDQAYEFSKKIDANLIIVSGTRLIKEKMLSLHPNIGILNLHTGLSPYIKGGPNCTNWCIANAQFHLIGNTIMWIDAGIDSGNILTTEFTPLDGNENLDQIHLKVMEHAHDLYLRAIKSVLAGKQQSIPQNTIAKGITYYTRDWGLSKKIALIKNMAHFKIEVSTDRLKKAQQAITTIEL